MNATILFLTIRQGVLSANFGVRVMEELKRCPFCGCWPRFVSTLSGFWAVECGNPNCGVWMPAVAEKVDAIRMWNRRHLTNQPSGGEEEIK